MGIDGEILGLGYVWFSKAKCNSLCEMNKFVKLKKFVWIFLMATGGTDYSEPEEEFHTEGDLSLHAWDFGTSAWHGFVFGVCKITCPVIAL